jgi:hypothetical protein
MPCNTATPTVCGAGTEVVSAVSVYAVHEIAQFLRKDRSFIERMRIDPAAAIAHFALTDEERAAILSGNVGRLAALGAHGLHEACG